MWQTSVSQKFVDFDSVIWQTKISQIDKFLTNFGLSDDGVEIDEFYLVMPRHGD